ncbi:MAG: HAMP domain-containing histidine kinase [Flavobacterium sp.]|nr:HAMP domain-containing histidine kinase [Flavobacterium sp.]
MVSLSYKNRIAFNYILSTALLISIVFIALYQIIFHNVNAHINFNIQEEVKKHIDEIEIDTNNSYLIQVDQWRAREHNTVNVNPVFVQFLDCNNELIDKSPNLKGLQLQLFPAKDNNQLKDVFLNNKPIRQIQVPLYDNKVQIGYLFIAMSLDDSVVILQKLKNILLISFPLILFVLFFIARLIAGRSIKPVVSIIETASMITRDNLTDRIALPQNRDELYVLSTTINDFLDRIENAVEREKQFTSDASHELRTPLAILKGTLEVLVRKPRNQTEYEEKIGFCVKEIDRLNQLVDELLLLARFENQKLNAKSEDVYLNALVLDVLATYSQSIKENKISILSSFEKEYYTKSDHYLVGIILSNILSNAIKYSKEGGEINIQFFEEDDALLCTISDRGIGISEEDISKVVHPFYRAQAYNHPEIKGVGLGLSIVNRLCTLLKIGFFIESQEKIGTTVYLRFPKHSLS